MLVSQIRSISLLEIKYDGRYSGGGSCFNFIVGKNRENNPAR